MARHALIRLTSSLVGCATLALAIAKPVEAAMLTYDFEVNVTSGTSIGKYKGNFSFDTSKPLFLCDVVQGYYCANPVSNDLTVTFDFLGKTYTEKDDSQYSLFPTAVFNSPVLNAQSSQSVALSYLVSPLNADGFFVFGGDFHVGRGDDLFDAVTKVGTVIYSLRLPGPKPGPQPGPQPGPDPCQGDSCAAVPEPSEIAGSVIGLGLLGAVWQLRRKRSPLKVK
jgi:hypothetical protein